MPVSAPTNSLPLSGKNSQTLPQTRCVTEAGLGAEEATGSMGGTAGGAGPPVRGAPAAAGHAAAGAPELGPHWRLDLSFRDERLEAAFQKHHRHSKRVIVARFAVFRGVALAFLFVRALSVGEGVSAALALCMSAASFAPLLADLAAPGSLMSGRLGDATITAVDVAQAVVGCHIMPIISPSNEGASALASLAHVVHGSGVLWTHFYSAFSPLPFRLVLLQQAAVTLVLLTCSSSLCAYSWALRMGYCMVRHMTGTVLASLHASLWRLAGWAEWRDPAASDQQAEQQLCVRFQQVLLLLPGFVAATRAVFCSERSLRLRFLAQLREQQQRHEQQQRRQQQHDRVQPLGHEEQPAEVAWAAAQLVPAAHVPSDLDYFLNFALPAVLVMWFYTC